jgi:hypothetical protein
MFVCCLVADRVSVAVVDIDMWATQMERIDVSPSVSVSCLCPMQLRGCGGGLVLSCTVLCSLVLTRPVLYCLVLSCTVWYCPVLSCLLLS